MAEEKPISIMLWSATVDRLYPVAMLAAGAAAMGRPVSIFLTFWGVEAFRKGAPEANTQVSTDYAALGEKLLALIQQKNVAPWHQTLAQAKELGEVTVHACGMTMDLFGLTMDDMDELVDDIEGMASFVDHAADGAIIFV